MIKPYMNHCLSRGHPLNENSVFPAVLSRIKFIENVHGVFFHLQDKGIHFFIEITISNQGRDCDKKSEYGCSDRFCKPRGKRLGLSQPQLGNNPKDIF